MHSNFAKSYSWRVFFPAALLCLVTACSTTVRVTLVGDSMLACGRDTIVATIHANPAPTRVTTEYLQGGCTSYSNTINKEFANSDPATAFGNPDVVVFSFAGNEMGRVVRKAITFEVAVESMQHLIHQAVAAGAHCIVMLESSHRLRADISINDEFEQAMDRWFMHWQSRAGDKEFGGKEYRFLIADISGTVHADIDRYIGDYIHFNPAGAQLAADAIVVQINACR
jgi:hypothetical protein